MNVTMFVILALIVVPGYFLVKRLSGTIYSDNAKLEKETEHRYGFEQAEKEREKNKAEKTDETVNTSREPRDTRRNKKKTEASNEKKNSDL